MAMCIDASSSSDMFPTEAISRERGLPPRDQSAVASDSQPFGDNLALRDRHEPSGWAAINQSKGDYQHSAHTLPIYIPTARRPGLRLATPGSSWPLRVPAGHSPSHTPLCLPVPPTVPIIFEPVPDWLCASRETANGEPVHDVTQHATRVLIMSAIVPGEQLVVSRHIGVVSSHI